MSTPTNNRAALEAIVGQIRNASVYDYLPSRLKQQSAIPKEEHDKAMKKLKAEAVKQLEALLKQAQSEARIDERRQFIVDDKTGRNAAYIAKQKQLHFHNHNFDFNSYMCSCGISRKDAESLDRLDLAALAALQEGKS